MKKQALLGESHKILKVIQKILADKKKENGQQSKYRSSPLG